MKNWDRQTTRQRYEEICRQMGRQTDKNKDKQIKYRDKQINKIWTDRQTKTWTNKQADRQTDRR